MKIGIDLTPIQGPHRMRGIGYTLINFINHLPPDEREKHSYVLYVYPDEFSIFGNPLRILDLHDMDYEVRTISPRKRIGKKLPGKLNLFISALNSLLEIKDLKFGDSRIRDLKGIEAFLQLDQAQSLPHKRSIKKLLVVYDIIPYVLEWDYLWSYKTAREVRGYSRKAAFRCHVRRLLYYYKLKLNIKRANTLLAISEVTKNDFIATYPFSKSKIIVTPLGVPKIKQSRDEVASLKRYKKTSWGYLPYVFDIDMDVPYLLFVGGADRRRKLEDVVTAYHQLRAQNINIRLVLAGDSMQGPESIATEEIQGALKTSSYLDDIVFMGFIDDSVRDWLYKHALAFVFPSRYEGFGLPVLEAMSYSCPVISYRNDATLEVAGTSPLYVDNVNELVDATKSLLSKNKIQIKAMTDRGLKRVELYDWVKTSANIIASIQN